MPNNDLDLKEKLLSWVNKLDKDDLKNLYYHHNGYTGGIRIEYRA